MILLQRRTLLAYLAFAGISAPRLALAQNKGDLAFPVTVGHAFGSTTVPLKPRRIVTIGSHDEDSVLLLGEMPVGIVTFNIFHHGLAPWVQERISGPAPAILSPLLDFEQIAALQPDLILAVSSGITSIDWQRLSRIAPTIAYSSRPWASDWREQLIVTGLALGQPDKASARIAAVDRLLSNVAAAHPELHGRSFCIAAYDRGSGTITLLLENNPTVKAFSALGLRPCGLVQSLGRTHVQQMAASVGPENVDAIDADLLVVWFRGGGDTLPVRLPLFDFIPAIRNGRALLVENPTEAEALASPTALSIPYVYPAIASKLAELATNRPG